MLNYWWVTRPKRKLNSIPEVLSTFAEISLDQEWQGQRDSHLSLEDALEEAGFRNAVIKACDACYEKATGLKK